MADEKCPTCDDPLRFVGAIGLTDTDQTWDAQADRWECATGGHTVFVVHTNRVVPAEDA